MLTRFNKSLSSKNWFNTFTVLAVLPVLTLFPVLTIPVNKFDQLINIILISNIDTTHISDAGYSQGQCNVNKDKAKACR